MLVTEKKITRVMVHLDNDEIICLEDSKDILEYLETILTENGAKEFVSTSTGEVIDMEDLLRLKGILSGLISCKEWILE